VATFLKLLSKNQKTTSKLEMFVGYAQNLMLLNNVLWSLALKGTMAIAYG
jgi:hypothetical protein